MSKSTDHSALPSYRLLPFLLLLKYSPRNTSNPFSTTISNPTLYPLNKLLRINAGKITQSYRCNGYNRHLFFIGPVPGEYSKGKKSEQRSVSITGNGEKRIDDTLVINSSIEKNKENQQ